MDELNQIELDLLKARLERKKKRLEAVQEQYDFETRAEDALRQEVLLKQDFQKIAEILSQIKQIETRLAKEPVKQWWQTQGTDEYGRYAEVCVKGVCQRLRWIMAEDRSFWLADTPCTQAFWRVVMGNNPAEFKGDERPVERVSWYMAQDFLEELNKSVNGLQARLPTEAEWVLGCEVLEQVHRNAESTTEVKALPPNSMGLYQMLGNVWEWCADDFDDSGDVKVLRGGCWGDKQFDIRMRGRCAAGNRDYTVGFRWIVEG